jgi:two-component system chemotaxis response regulator CheY
MPEMDGFEFLERIKANPDFKPIPVMMLTTESERGKIIQAIKAGAVNYICKPAGGPHRKDHRKPGGSGDRLIS